MAMWHFHQFTLSVFERLSNKKTLHIRMVDSKLKPNTSTNFRQTETMHIFLCRVPNGYLGKRVLSVAECLCHSSYTLYTQTHTNVHPTSACSYLDIHTENELIWPMHMRKQTTKCKCKCHELSRREKQPSTANITNE